MQIEDEKSEIKVQSYVWKTSLMYLTGHYEFEIVFKKFKGKNVSQKTVYRRFSDIEILHEGLLRFNPGCRQAPLPEKSIWCNLFVNNDYSLEKRKKGIEEYLNYINNHKYLKFNPIYNIFLSDDFERYKSEYLKNKTISDKISRLKEYFPSFFKLRIIKSDLLDDSFLTVERDNLMRLYKGISDTQKIIENIIKINEDRIDSLRNILTVSKSLENTNLRIEQPEIDDDYRNNKKGLETNIEIFYNLYDKNKTYCKLLIESVLDSLKKYMIEVEGLKDIYERKDKLLETLRKLKIAKNEEHILDRHIEIAEIEDLLINLDHQLVEEIKLFKISREKDILIIIKKFFKERQNYEYEVAAVFNYEVYPLQIDLNQQINESMENHENHFG